MWTVEGEDATSTEVYSCFWRPGQKDAWGAGKGQFCMYGFSDLSVDEWYNLPLGKGIKPKVFALRDLKFKNKNHLRVRENMMSIEIER